MTAQLPIEFDKTPAEIVGAKTSVEEFLKKVDGVIDAFKPDLKTAKARKEIASLAAKMSSSKTAIDGAGKAMTAELKAKTKKIDEIRKFARDEFDRRRDQVRKPLTDWEEEQAAIKSRRDNEYQRLVNLGCVGFGETSESIKERIALVNKFDLGDWWGDLLDKVKVEHSRSLASLNTQFLQAEQSEKQSAELADLKRKQEETEREARNAETAAKAEQEARENAEREKRDAEQRQEREAQQAKEVQERRKTELAEAEERARRQEQERIEAEKHRKEQEEAKRRADAEHHDKVIGEAVAVISEKTGLSVVQAVKVIELIETGQVPNVSIRF